jgi:pyridoxine 4-dehydrogenase
MVESASHSHDTLGIGSDMAVHRLGFGAMRITGEGVWGEPRDPEQARRVLRRVEELGIDFIDTADSYGPEVSERLIGEVLGPNSKVIVATKGGLVRTGPNQWLPLGRPEYLRQCVLMSLRRLGRERLDLWQLHRIDPKVPRDEQFDAMAQMQREGLIRHLGLSNVGVAEVQAARAHFQVVTVQNLYNLLVRRSEDVLDYCTEHGIGFIPWFPVGAGKLAQPRSKLSQLANRLGATPAQVALAWLLNRSPLMLVIPGTSSVEHLEQNAAAAGLKLSEADMAALEELTEPPRGTAAGS